MTKNKNKIEDVEFGLDSRYYSKKEAELEATELMEARLNGMKKLTTLQIDSAQLMQLKLKNTYPTH